jgi:hypothetical protein
VPKNKPRESSPMWPVVRESLSLSLAHLLRLGLSLIHRNTPRLTIITKQNRTSLPINPPHLKQLSTCPRTLTRTLLKTHTHTHTHRHGDDDGEPGHSESSLLISAPRPRTEHTATMSSEAQAGDRSSFSSLWNKGKQKLKGAKAPSEAESESPGNRTSECERYQ